MDSKNLTTILIVLVCIFMFPIIIGAIGGVFGIIGSVIGGIFGMIGGLFGAVFGVIGGFFGAIFGFFSWLFGEPFGWHWPAFFHLNPVTVILVVAVIVLLVRSRRVRPGKQP